MSLINEAVFGSIDINVLKETSIWKQHQNSSGRVPFEILVQMLDILGFDTFSQKKPFSSFVKTIRNPLNKLTGYQTVIFNGKIKPNCPWIKAFEKNEIITKGTKDVDKLIMLCDYGLDKNTWKNLN